MSKTCHEKGCTKLATFHKERKTSGKFCGEHKKNGMISIMYRHYNNQADQVFRALPQALQWEILVQFVGGFVVRNNRLRRIMSGELQEKIMEHNFSLNWLSLRRLWLKPLVEFPTPNRLFMSALNRGNNVLNFRCDGQPWTDTGDPDRLLIISSAEFSRKEYFVTLFSDGGYNGRLSYGYRFSYRWYITEMDDSITLPPFEKHVYPSYPYTNKKIGRPLLKMKLHAPVQGKIPSGLNYAETRSWLEGRRILSGKIDMPISFIFD
uniref:Uncharacterized protein n=1 Tax=viral metagenome TaxID=1070528 RepID=A0A6C0HI91_9ZZZZ